MNWLLILLLLALCLWLLFQGVSRSGRIYEYPFLAGATFLGFILPQMPGLAADPFLPPDAFAKAAFFTILCAGACYLGWNAGRRPLKGFDWIFDEQRLLWVAASLSLIGAFFFFKISRLPPEATSANQVWTGAAVAYMFFARLLTYGFAIAVVCFARRPSKVALAIALFDAMFYMDRILIAGRRGETADFVFMIALAAWFYRGIAIPRVLAIGAIVVGALFLSSTDRYRSITNDMDGPEWASIANIDFVANFKESLEQGGLEMRNAVMRIHFVDRSQIFDYGLSHWNTLVFNFVPAQIVGTELKESLLIPIKQYADGYVPTLGTTETGMADAFGSFWYIGAIKFFIVAYLLGRCYLAAVAGNTVYRLLYMLTLTPAMLTITHHTQWVLSTWVHMAMLLLPFLVLAKVNIRHSVRSRRQHVMASI